MCRHRVQFYDSEAFLLRKVAGFIVSALDGGGNAIVIATPSHLRVLRVLLDRHAVPAGSSDRLVCLDAQETLARFMVDGLPDAQRFAAAVGVLLEQSSDGGRRHVSVFGEMVAMLYAEGNAEAAARLEQMWDGLFEHQAFSLLCAYPMNLFPDQTHRQAFHAICEAHSHVDPLETVEDAAADPGRLNGTIARLQQATNSLDREVLRRQEGDRLLIWQTARISVLEREQAELKSLAERDSLTGLANRRAFTACLTRAFARAQRARSGLALLFVDLDDFKAFNDRFGHEAGDRMLMEVATRLSGCVRASDTLCRLGGDEFTVLMEEGGASEAARLAQRIVDALAKKFTLGDEAVAVTASIGIGLYPQDDVCDAQALLRSADKAMYRAKTLGKHGYTASATASVGMQRSGVLAEGGHGADLLPERTHGAAAWMTVEAAALNLQLSRPHVAKLIVEGRFSNVVHQRGALPLILSSEVSRVARELFQA